MIACQYFEPYMAPIALLLVFLKYYVSHFWGASKIGDDEDEQQTDEDDQQEDQQDDQDDEKFKVRTQIWELITIKIKFFNKYL